MDLWSIGRDVIMLVVTILVFYWGRDRKQTADLIEARFQRMQENFEQELELRDQKLDQIFVTLERANLRASELAGYVQTIIGRLDRMPEELRGKFFPADRAIDLIEESRRDRQQLWRATEEAKQDRNQLWEMIGRRRPDPRRRGGTDG